MPSDLSSPRLGERSLKRIDDISNWGLRNGCWAKSTSHMNINYLRAARLPDWDHYGELLEAPAHADNFIGTGEVLLPEVKLSGESVHARVSHTFPLRMAEVVWGNGSQTFRKEIPLEETREFSETMVDAKIEAPGWKWARFAVWDVAGNGAMTNPVWK